MTALTGPGPHAFAPDDVPEKGVMTPADVKTLKWNLHNVGYDGPSAAPAEWTFVKELGDAGEAVVDLYIRTDARGHVVDRIVQRNVVQGGFVFNEEIMWAGGVVGFLPVEIWINKMLNNIPNIVSCRSHVVDAQRALYKSYLEYVEYDNLGSLIRNQARSGIRVRYGKRFKVMQERPFPEPFLWWLFMGLARGLAAMNAASAAEVPIPLEIVMLDMKPNNVFLGTENPTEFRLFPTPKIGDFGSAYATHAADTNDRADYMDYRVKATQYSAPEFIPMVDPVGNVLVDGETGSTLFEHFGAQNALASANVYQVGIILLCCMRLQEIPNPPILPHGPNPMDGYAAEYSQTLRDLVDQCMQYQPTARPTAQALLNAINTLGPPHWDGMDVYATSVGKSSFHRHKLRMRQVDGYKVGMMFRPPGPPKPYVPHNYPL